MSRRTTITNINSLSKVKKNLDHLKKNHES